MKGVNSYQPLTTQARPWDEIENQFIEDVNSRPARNILNLVKHIRSSGLSKRLYAFTSHDKLVISIYDPIEWNKESLHVEFHHGEQKWSFQYFAKPFSDPEFVRQYNEHLGIEKFDNFIKIINW